MGLPTQSIRVSGKAYGVCLAMETNRPEILERVAPILPPLWEQHHWAPIDRRYALLAEPGAAYRLLVNGRRLLVSADLDYAVDRLETDIQIYLGETSPHHVFVHAGVVGWQGQAIVIPGRSYSGKTTLVAALLRAGATYYSDEFAVLDAQGRVHPYPRLLSLRQPDGQRPLRCRPETLGSRSGELPLPVGVVVLAHYRPDHRWQPLTLAPGPAVLELIRHCVPIRRRPGETLTALHHMLSQATVLHGARGEAEELVQDLLNCR